MPGIVFMVPNTIKLVAISGGSGSGKTTFARKLAHSMGEDRVLILSQDSYYIDQSSRFDGDGGSVNFDHPSALDFVLLAVHLSALAAGRDVEVPIYDFSTHTRLKRTDLALSKPLVFVDGTLLLSQASLVPLFHRKVYIDVPEQVRFERRLKRDVAQRGREPEGVTRQFELQVAPMHRQFVQPSSAHADVIINYGDDFDDWVSKLKVLLEGAKA